MTSSAVRSDDPWAELVYAAHHHALDEVGPVFRRWVQLQDFVDRVTADDEWFESFENAPIEVTAERRSHSARYSVALTDQATILIRGGSWNAPIVSWNRANHRSKCVGVNSRWAWTSRWARNGLS